MKPRFLVIFLSALLLAASAVHPAWGIEPSVTLSDYYSAANGKKGDNLRTTLGSIISTNQGKGSSHTVVSYDDLAYLMKYSDTKDADGVNIVDIYSDCPYTVSGDKLTWSSPANVGGGLNREHTVPQSWFDKKSPYVSDAFHIYPTDGKANNNRSSYQFGEVSGTGTQYTGTYKGATVHELGKKGSSSWQNSPPSYTVGSVTYTPSETYSGTVYEPGNEYKGDIARGIFYMATRYHSVCSGWGNMFGSEKGLTAYIVELLLKWHRQDPVSDKELLRNEVIYGNTNYNKSSFAQGNRNPFIDYPELVEYIWGDKSTTAVVLDDLTSAYGESTALSTTITFAHSTVNVQIGATTNNAATANSGGAITYSSSNTNVATVSSTGVITGVAAGSCTITATVAANGDYPAKSTTCEVTVFNAADNYNVYWVVNWDYTNLFDSNTAPNGGKPTVPANEPKCEGKVFMGWTHQASFSPSTGPTKIFKDGADANDINNDPTYYYAVFATQNSSGTETEDIEKSIKFAEAEYENGDDVTTVSMDNCTLIFDKGTGSNAPKYYTSGEAVRCYKNNTLTISSEDNITNIVISTVSGYAGTISADDGTYSGGTWTGSSKSITLTHSPSDNSQWRITAITVTTEGTGSTTTYSNYTAECGETPEPCTQLTQPNVTAVPGDQQITLTWPKVEDAVSYTVIIDDGDGYTTECLATANIGEVTTTDGTCTCIITGLTNGLTYTTLVEAVAAETSCNSDVDEDTATPLADCQATVTVVTDNTDWGTVSVE